MIIIIKTEMSGVARRHWTELETGHHSPVQGYYYYYYYYYIIIMLL